MTDVCSNLDHPSGRGVEKYTAEGAGAFHYGSLSPEIAKAVNAGVKMHRFSGAKIHQ